MWGKDAWVIGEKHTGLSVVWKKRYASLLTRVLVLSVSVLFVSHPASADTTTPPPLPSRDTLTFLNKDGTVLPAQEVQARMQALNDATRQLYDDWGEPTTAQKLKLITFNAGLLDTGTVVKVPKYKERAPYLIPALQQADFDVLCLQEVFYWQDLHRLERFAADHGYYFYRGHSGRLRNRHGLVLLVKKDLSSHAPTFQEHRFRVAAWYERLFGYKKSMLSASLRLINGRTVTFTNTHVTAFKRQERTRVSQLQDMMRAVIELADADYLFVSGDFNEAMERKPVNPDLKLNIVQRLISKFHLVDSYSVAQPGKNEATVSRTENPTSAFGFTSAFGRGVDGRIDFVFATTRKDRHVLVEDAHRIFTEDLPIPLKPPWYIRWWKPGLTRHTRQNCKLSDHFGLLSEATLF